MDDNAELAAARGTLMTAQAHRRAAVRPDEQAAADQSVKQAMQRFQEVSGRVGMSAAAPAGPTPFKPGPGAEVAKSVIPSLGALSNALGGSK